MWSMLRRSPDNESDDARQRTAMMASGDRRKQLANLNVPTLVIHGDQDPVIRPQGGCSHAPSKRTDWGGCSWSPRSW